MADEQQTPEEAREERLARNEVLFRSVNKKIEQQALEFGGLDSTSSSASARAPHASNGSR